VVIQSVRLRAIPAILAISLLIWLPFTGATFVRAQQPSPTVTLVITTPTPQHLVLPTPTPKPVATLAPEVAPSQAHNATPEDYTVQPGDTLLSVALEMGVDLEDMGCVVRPDFRYDQPLVIGDVLEPLPGSVICHQAAEDESLASIAGQYGVDPASIIALPWNRLNKSLAPTAVLSTGRFVRVPLTLARGQDLPAVIDQPTDGRFLTWMLTQPVNAAPQAGFGVGGVRRPQDIAPVAADWPYGSGNFTWPTYGWLTQGYRRDHRAVDIAAPVGSPVTAADRGVVIRAGWNNQGYGNFVVIDHNIDYITLYAHLDTIFVDVGDVVGQGQVLGTVGSTGNSTGPHLHFEIRDFGRLINPMELLAR
jgi:murein DD-endopeptidase MepM/ murein hydrolase activator NlpD